ncbi:MAG TPA: alpha/beta hydrolase-fold protein [Ktedonobacteraceae bacterium]|nr:alpha/beta hydrolase-fold protein [Ktedonobacteraceae bacterium]
MNTSSMFSKWQKQLALLWDLLPVLVAFLTALLSSLWLLSGSIFSDLVNAIVLTSVDVARSTLIAALLMAIAGGALGTFLGRRKFSAMLGAGFAFWLGYVSPFVQQQLQPQRDEAGLLLTLNQDVLTHTAFTMIALGLLCAFIGAAIGMALSNVFLDPIFTLVKTLWTRLPPQAHYLAFTRGGATATLPPQIRRPQPILKVIASLIGIAGMITLLILASGSGDLFLFAPDAGVHGAPLAHTSHLEGVPYYGTIVHETITSPTLHQQKPLIVYLPPTYNTPLGRNKRYPVLYMLHGSPGGTIDWIRGGHLTDKADELINLNQIPELIIVFPDGNVSFGSSEWGDNINHKASIESYFVNDVVPYIDQKYRTIPNAANRAIGGNSMGGFGATNIAIHHPSMFGFVVSLGGYYNAEQRVWGKSETYRLQNSPNYTLPRSKTAQKINMFIGAATKDQPYYNDSKEFIKLLQKLHVPYHADIQVGRHAWKIWELQAYDALLWIHWGTTGPQSGTPTPAFSSNPQPTAMNNNHLIQ